MTTDLIKYDGFCREIEIDGHTLDTGFSIERADRLLDLERRFIRGQAELVLLLCAVEEERLHYLRGYATIREYAQALTEYGATQVGLYVRAAGLWGREGIEQLEAAGLGDYALALSGLPETEARRLLDEGEIEVPADDAADPPRLIGAAALREHTGREIRKLVSRVRKSTDGKRQASLAPETWRPAPGQAPSDGRLLAVLAACEERAGRWVTLEEIEDATGLARSTAHDKLGQLVLAGRLDKREGRYTLALAAIRVITAALRSAHGAAAPELKGEVDARRAAEEALVRAESGPNEAEEALDDLLEGEDS